MSSKRKKREKAERIHRQAIVREVARILAPGTPTLFRFESACRRGLRSAMCLKGQGWHEADDKAGRIVVLALHRIGASHRPTWNAGQREAAAAYGGIEWRWCTTCGGTLEDRSRPWCSDECRRGYWGRHYEATGGRDEAAKQAATRVVLTGGAEQPALPTEHRCRQCFKLYRPTRGPRQRYCSTACYVAAGPRVAERVCPVCDDAFVGRSNARLYCSDACATEAARGKRAARASVSA